MINSKSKGVRFERELANELKARGYNGDADVVGLPGIHIEAKRQEKMQLYDWMEQAKRDAKPGKLPAVFHKRNNHGILVTMTFDDWMILYGASYDTEEE